MILGTAHFANPGHDIQNPKIENILMPNRQSQIEDLVSSLVAWKPTHIAVEWPAKDQAGLDKQYSDFRAGHVALGASEKDQIGLRLAAKLGLSRVDAVDYIDLPPGPSSAYDIEEGSKIASEQRRLAAVESPQLANQITNLFDANTVAGFLAALNKPSFLDDMNRVYYDFALLGTNDNNPGANWVGGWYARNLKIFANIVRLNAKPDDRILVIFGAGHGHFLNTFAVDSHAFRLVRPEAALRAADGR